MVPEDGSSLFLHHHFALVVELALVPVGAVKKMGLASCWAGCNGGQLSLIMGSALISASAALSAFRMCHFTL